MVSRHLNKLNCGTEEDPSAPYQGRKSKAAPPPSPPSQGRWSYQTPFSYHTRTMLDIFRLGQILHSSLPLLPFLLFSFFLPAVFSFPSISCFCPTSLASPPSPALPFPPSPSLTFSLPSPPLRFPLPSSPSFLFPLHFFSIRLFFFLLIPVVLFLLFLTFLSYLLSPLLFWQA